MPVKINASSSSGLVVDSDLTGSLQLQTGGNPAISIDSSQVVNFTKQFQIGGVLPPAFSAYAASNQSISNITDTKITLDTELFDTNSNFASSRFTPTVAGYYQISATIKTTSSGNLRRADIELFKNGSLYQVGSSIDLGASSTGTSFIQSTISTVIYFNGSTDYVELYIYSQTNSGSITVAGGSDKTWMSGCLVRSA